MDGEIKIDGKVVGRMLSWHAVHEVHAGSMVISWRKMQVERPVPVLRVPGANQDDLQQLRQHMEDASRSAPASIPVRFFDISTVTDPADP